MAAPLSLKEHQSSSVIVNYFIFNTSTLWKVLLIAALILRAGCSGTDSLKGTQGEDITLKFTLGSNRTRSISSVALYTVPLDNKKIHECPFLKHCSTNHTCVFNNSSMSALFCITNLTLNHAGTYWVAFYKENGVDVLEESTKISLTVQSHNRSQVPTDAPRTNTDSSVSKDTGKSKELVMVVILMGTLAVALLAGLLSWLAWSHCKATEKQVQQQPDSTAQEITEVSNQAPPLIYSLLDFPKRAPSGVEAGQMEVWSTDTDYAAITYPAKISHV